MGVKSGMHSGLGSLLFVEGHGWFLLCGNMIIIERKKNVPVNCVRRKYTFRLHKFIMKHFSLQLYPVAESVKTLY
jgi:hypothetical protein